MGCGASGGRNANGAAPEQQATPEGTKQATSAPAPTAAPTTADPPEKTLLPSAAGPNPSKETASTAALTSDLAPVLPVSQEGDAADIEEGSVPAGAQARLAQPLHVDTKEKIDKLMPMEESRAAIVSLPPEDLPIVGTRTSEFRDILPQTGSGISTVLEDCINDLSSEVFGLPFSVSIGIPSIHDTPLIGISEGFLKLSGYARNEIVGQNCRLLLRGVPEGEVNADVRQEARRYCRAAHLRGLTSMANTLLLQRNARKSGELFWNLFMLSLVPGPDKKRTYIVGLQLDLGPDLPPEYQTNPTAAIEAHREHLLLVQSCMFGKSVPAALQDKSSQAVATFSGLATDVKEWLAHAEGQSEMFQEWGTLPLAAWPGASSNHALLNGGVTLLRLEADKVATGAAAMTIFPIDKARQGKRSFKVQIDEICPFWGTKMSEAAQLPFVGFLKSTPSEIDALGGLPAELKSLAGILCMTGDGHVFMSSGGETKQLGETAPPCFDYEIKATDNIEIIWSKNKIQLEANGDAVRTVQDPMIGSPPKGPIFGVIDCSYTVCRLTLMA